MSMRACELSKWKEPHYIEALPAAYAETGDFDKAVKYQTQAINIKSGSARFTKRNANVLRSTRHISLRAPNRWLRTETRQSHFAWRKRLPVETDLPKESSVQFMRSRFTIGIIAGFSWFTLVFEVTGAESPGPDFPISSPNSRTSSSSREERAAAYYNRAIVYGQKRNYRLAIRDLTTTIQLNPKFANAYHNRGACYGETGDFERSIADYSEAIRLDPSSASTFNDRALGYRYFEQFGKAIADYDG